MTAYQFFLKHAGFNYDPKTETKAKGRARCARALATAELESRAAGLSFAWSIDTDIDSSEFSSEQPTWVTWQCVCTDRAGTVRASLHGIDFGREGTPDSDRAPYARVVEAELASEAL